MTQHSGLITIDIDDLVKDNIDYIKQNVTEEMPIVFVFTSPSGKGLKVTFKIDSDILTQKQHYESAVTYLKDKFGIQGENFDMSCSNVSRLCFLCWDENIWINPLLSHNDYSRIVTLDSRTLIKSNERNPESNKKSITEINTFIGDINSLDFKHKPERSNFFFLVALTIRKHGEFQKGIRHTFLQCLASSANHFGFPKNEFLALVNEYVETHPNCNDFKLVEVQQIVNDVYTRYQDQFSVWDENELKEEFETPIFQQSIYDGLPPLLKKPSPILANNLRQRDIFLIGMLGVFSNWMPKVYGPYNGKNYSANMFFFVSAPASAGKGALSWARKACKYVVQELTDEFKKQMSRYEEELKEYEKNKNSDTSLEKPVRPEKKKFIIPANISSSGIINILHSNNDFGLIFETEADTLSNSLQMEWGNFTDTLRKAFEHEPISSYRQTNKEDIEIHRSQLSMVLSGTPQQVIRLLSSIENGVFSRMMFYDFPFHLDWQNVFSKESKIYEDYFDAYGKKINDLLKVYFQGYLEEDKIEFCLTEEQQDRFNLYFSIKQEQLYLIFGNEIVASIRRLGVNFFRIAMILSVLREIESCNEKVELLGKKDKIYCQEIDYNTTEQVVECLLIHTVHIFKKVCKKNRNKSLAAKRDVFYQSLPENFQRKDWVDLATYIGLNQKTAEKYIERFIQESLIERVEHNNYRRIV